MRLSRLKIIMIAALKVDEQRPSSDFCCEIIGLINRLLRFGPETDRPRESDPDSQALSPCSARPPGSTLRVRKLTATNLEEILPEFDSKSTAAVPRDVPIDLEQISLDDGCGFLPSPCL